MVLTITPIAQLNKSSFLRPFGDELAISVSSDTSLVGKDVYILIGLFANSFDDLPDLTGLPKFGYKVAFPGSNSTVEMAKQSHEYSYLWENMAIKLQRTSTTAMTITPSGLMRADVNSISNNLPIYPIQSLLRNATQNGIDLDNKTPSVYNSLKSLRVIVVVADTTGVLSYQFIDIPYTSRFYEEGLYGGGSEFTNFDYKVVNLSVYGAGFSLNTNSVIRFSCTGAWTAGGWIAIFEDNGTNNASDFVIDTNLHIKYFDGTITAGTAVTMNTTENFPNSAFVGFSAVTLIGGTTKYVDVTFNAAYFDKTKTYRVVFIPVKVNDYSNSFITDPIEVTDFVTPTYGTVEEHMNVYNSIETPFEKCVSGLVPHERLFSYYAHNKEDYNADVVSNSSSGTFDSNFKSVKLFVGFLAIPNTKKFDVSTAEEITSFSTTETSSLFSAETNIAMRPEWVNKQLYLTYQLIFEITQDDGTKSTDFIYYQKPFFVVDYTEAGINILYQLDQNNNLLTKICGDTTEIKILYEVAETGNYEYIAYLEEEYDPYSSGGEVLIKKENSKILSQGEIIIAGNPNVPDGTYQSIVIDAKKLVSNKEYCLEIIAENKDHILGTCESTTIDLELTYLGSGNLKVAYNNIGLGVKQVELIIRPITNKKFLVNLVKNYIFNDASGETDQFSFKGQTWSYTILIDVTIKTENNCIIQGSVEMTILKGAAPTTSTLNLNPI